MPQGKHVHTHQEDILGLNTDENGPEQDFKGTRLLTNSLREEGFTNPALPTYEGLLPFFGEHRSEHGGETPGARHNAETDRR